MIILQTRRSRGISRLFSTLRTLHQHSQSNSATTHPTESDAYKPLTFTGNTHIAATPEERMSSVFGGRIKGEARVSSSRKEASTSRIIAGVEVLNKPPEPDNCCMSGCVNCVWEQYNDDIKDWRRKRNKAVEAISKTNEVWPADFQPPLKKLDIKNVPRELRAAKRKLSKEKKVSTASYFPTTGKPGAQNITQSQQEAEVSKEEEEEDWANVPVSMRVFAQTEAMVKKKRAERLAKKQ